MTNPTVKRKRVKKKTELHYPWCAAVIAQNAMVPWSVKCDCAQNPASTKGKKK